MKIYKVGKVGSVKEEAEICERGWSVWGGGKSTVVERDHREKLASGECCAKINNAQSKKSAAEEIDRQIEGLQRPV